MKSVKSYKRKTKGSFLEGIERMNPHLMFLCLALLGSLVLFAALLIGFNLNYPLLKTVEMPKAFYISTAIIATSGVVLMPIFKFYKAERMAALAKVLGLVFILSIAFTLSQVVGWAQLYSQQVISSGGVFSSYLYVITGLHFIHVIGGMTYLFILFFKYINAASDTVQELIVVTNPYEFVKLRMLYYIWLFLDVIWLIVFVNFLIIT